MLRALAIRHFAIISELDIRLEPGFTAITGETGAGKSILVDALGLLLGNRADSALVATGARQAELSATFDIREIATVREWLDDQAMDEGDDLLLRRVISADGRSRAWINGRSATISQLGELGARLVEIHGQHEHQRLEKPEVQRRLLDGELDSAIPGNVASAWSRWNEASQALNEFEQDAGDPEAIELLRYQCRELNELSLAEGEFEQLEAEQDRLSRSDEIRQAAANASAAIDQDDTPSVRSLMQAALHQLSPVSDSDPRLAEAATMLEEARINIDEAYALIERVGDEELGDPERLAEVNQKLQRALDLARKHRVEPAELPELTVSLNQRLEQLESQGEKRTSLEAEVQTARQLWEEAAASLSAARAEAAAAISTRARDCLAELGMDRASIEFSIEVRSESTPSPHGRDAVRVDFTANPGQSPKPLTRVASGGELSRVALALMIATGNREGTRTRIFDEVDAGVGGETAHAVGRFLRQAAGQGQALCVTHLAQVAACADHQLRVTKHNEKDTTDTQIEHLDPTARKHEIARMLGNAESSTSLAHAEEMLGGGEGEV